MNNTLKKRIAVLVPYTVHDGFRGAQQDVRFRLQLFREMGLQVHVFQWSTELTERQDSTIEGIQYTTLPRASEKKRFGYYKAAGLDNERTTTEIIRTIQEESVDIVWCETIALADVVKRLHQELDIPVHARSHNYERGHAVEQWIYALREQKCPSDALRFVYEYIFAVLYERKLFSHATEIWSISDVDTQLYQRQFPKARIQTLPFFAEYTSSHQVRATKSLNAFYMGSNFTNNINRQGLEVLMKGVLPHIEGLPITLHIVGTEVPSGISSEQCVVHNYIEDLDQFLADMDIALLPNTIGYGMKIKAYEALKRGFPSIVSPRIHQVFGGEAQKTYALAGSPEEWRVALQKMESEERRREMSQNALSFMQNHFSKKQLQDALQSTFFSK